MNRLSGMKTAGGTTIVNNVSYNAANQLLGMTYDTIAESRSYNVLNQLTNITAGTSENLTYSYPTGTNNGKINSKYNAISGETVTYTYDSLNRLLTANGSGWGEQYGFDSFGNLLSKTVTAGSGPSLSQAVNPANNQIVGQSYDANGNASTVYNNGLTYSVGYDFENHLSSIYQSSNNTELADYVYDAQSKRIFSGPAGADSFGNLTNYTVYVYSPSGQRLGGYRLATAFIDNSKTNYVVTPTLRVTATSSDTYFGGRRLGVIDRLGSAVSATSPVVSYFPWGEAKGATNPQDNWNFGTYWQDSVSGLDYANNRYYSNAYGRFMTPDPYQGTSGGPGDPDNPQSWNRYAYTVGDPVNWIDPQGLWQEGPSLMDTPSILSFAPQPGPGGWGTSSYFSSAIAGAEQASLEMVANANANTKKVDSMLVQLRNALSSDPKCLDFLESGIAGNNLSVFNQYYNALDGANHQTPLAIAVDFSSLATEYQGQNGITGGITSGGIWINSGGAFFSSAVGVGYASVYASQVEGLTGGTPQAQFFILLHELSHFFGPQEFIQGDGTSRGAQKKNNDLLWKNCSKTIQSAGGGGIA